MCRVAVKQKFEKKGKNVYTLPMQLYRFHEEELPPEGGELSLSVENRRIAASVLRLGEGQEIELFNTAGQVARARITSTGRKQVRVSILQSRQAEAPLPRLTLLQGLPKGEKSAWVVQKGVECGVSRLVFFEGDHAVARKGRGQAERWKRVAIEAMRQSRNPILPGIEGPLSLEQVLPTLTESFRLFLDEGEEKNSIRRYLSLEPESIVVAVGSEGGWSDNDRRLLRAARFEPLRVGPFILRTETAALAAMSLCRALYG